jgi:hypothetical protein
MKRIVIALLLAAALNNPVYAQPAATTGQERTRSGKEGPRVSLAPPQALFRDAITLRQFVKGTLRFVMLHEMGHGLVDLYDLPVLGREEDAADRFATYWLSPDSSGEDGTDAAAAMEWWLASARLSDRKREDLPWWDEHGIDEQRGYQIACLLYGSAPDSYLPLTRRVGIPAKRLNGCRVEAAQNVTSWSILLNQHIAKVSKSPSLLVPLAYQDAGKDTADAAEIVKSMEVLEEIRDILVQFRRSKQTGMVLITAEDCGFSNAYWNPGTQSMTLCYELVNEIVGVGYAAGFR